jgi:alpha-ketoglutarate-dependent taurine dioxygenase
VSRDKNRLRMATNDPIVTRSIVGLKKEESEALLAFLFNHIGRGVDYQARVRWAPKTVVVWDVSASNNFDV